MYLATDTRKMTEKHTLHEAYKDIIYRKHIVYQQGVLVVME